MSERCRVDSIGVYRVFGTPLFWVYLINNRKCFKHTQTKTTTKRYKNGKCKQTFSTGWFFRTNAHPRAQFQICLGRLWEKTKSIDYTCKCHVRVEGRTTCEIKMLFTADHSNGRTAPVLCPSQIRFIWWPSLFY